MKLVILDGNSIVNRAFFGIRPMNAPDGTPTNGIYGFLSIMQKFLDSEKPDSVCVAFDLKAPTFRHLKYEGYKAQRKGMPEELAVQMPILREVLDAMGVKRLELEGFEADDLLGTVGRICEEKNWTCHIITGDKDSFQLITDTTHVVHVKSRMGQTETTEYTPEVFREEYGFEPRYIVDLKALMGDSSDNIPGVAGVGEKTAADLISHYTTVDYIYGHLGELEIKEGVRKKLDAGRENAMLSYELATICREAPIEFRPEDALWNRDYRPELQGIFKRLGFNKFIEKWGLDKVSESLPDESIEHFPRIENADFETLSAAIVGAECIAILPELGKNGAMSFDSLELCDGKNVYTAWWGSMLPGEFDKLKELVFSGEIKKLSHNVKDFMHLLMVEGLPVDGFIYDTALACYLLNATDRDHSLERSSMRYLKADLHGTEAIWRLKPVTEAKLSELDMEKLFYEIELPLCEVLADMELQGFLVDKQALAEFGDSLSFGIDELKDNIWQLAGGEFNINSPKQLGEVLFERLMLPSGKKKKTGWSTNADVLDKLRGKHPIVDMVLEYRMLTKLKSTYADGLLKLIDGNDGRIKTSFQMTVTATGRLSSTEPNLQNIPIRKELGSRIRRMFIAAPGKTLVDADYSQIELRLLAHISGDENMQAAFLSGEDIHRVTASQVFNTPFEEVTALQRSRAKAVNFGIVYGISAWSLSQDIGVMPYEAKEYMDAYLEKYSGVSRYMKDVVEQAKADGYVKTLYNRRRALPELSSKNFNERSFGERVALNMPIQGTAADIIKLAMVNVYRRLKKEKLRSRLILQVHDELICECPDDEVEAVKKLLDEEMENVTVLAVPLTAEAKAGHSWAEAH
ncbi:MAG: DNA polymerase I [Oscillospiraceae bacterium]|nr:DNA polymerase I [Oscillospiraceae bacterium]